MISGESQPVRRTRSWIGHAVERFGEKLVGLEHRVLALGFHPARDGLAVVVDEVAPQALDPLVALADALGVTVLVVDGAGVGVENSARRHEGDPQRGDRRRER